MQPNLQRDGGQVLPDVEGAPDVNSAGEGLGLEEGSPLQKERAWRQPSQAAAPACCCCLPLLPCLHPPSSLEIYLFIFVCGEGWWRQMVFSTPLFYRESGGAPDLEA